MNPYKCQILGTQHKSKYNHCVIPMKQFQFPFPLQRLFIFSPILTPTRIKLSFHPKESQSLYVGGYTEIADNLRYNSRPKAIGYCHTNLFWNFYGTCGTFWNFIIDVTVEYLYAQDE